METNDSIGYCICLHCNTRIQHIEGQPCRDNDCPQCGKKLIREGSYHHQLYLLKKGETSQDLTKFKSSK